MQKNEPMKLDEFKVFAKEHTLQEIANYFGCSKSLVSYTLKKYGIQKREKIKFVEE